MSSGVKDGVLVVRSNESQTGKQGLDYFEGISAESVGSAGILMRIVTIPPGSRAKAHYHEGHESAIHIKSGAVTMWYGEKLAEHHHAKAGDFLYVPPAVPHLPVNDSDSEPALFVVAHTDPNEQEHIVPLPELDRLVE